jgi:hypothetical protein
MRTETRTVQIGEWLGPIDWSYDFAAASWDRNGSFNPALIAERIARLHAVEDGLARGERWMVYAHGMARPVIEVGMYDGWPYWKPTPHYLTTTWMGGDPMSWMSPSGAYRVDHEDATWR